jgi:hydroxypyruvate isomerase
MADLTRREALTAAAAAALALGATGLGKVDAQAQAPAAPATKPQVRAVTKGRLKQSVSRWCYQRIPMPDFCKAVSEMGLTAIDLLEEPDWAVVRDFGLICSMGYAGGGSIANGLNVKANHDAIVKNFEQKIPKAAAMKVPNVITFFGNRRGMSDSEAIANCVEGLNRVKALGEEHGVTICIELLNSKVDHKDYHGDHTAFGIEIVKAVNSPRVKLLNDLYHMQIMEGDLIRNIRNGKDFFAHYHTGGVPGRHELDATQEVNWATVCTAIADTGFQGYLAHEFTPSAGRDPLTSLREAVVLCDV